MRTEITDTYWVKIYIAGPIEVAKQLIRKKAMLTGMCVTIEPTTYIYTGGEEEGYVVGFINYPRFPKSFNGIWEDALKLAHELRNETGQHSFTLLAPDETFWYSERKE
jgi:hypothetical protein